MRSDILVVAERGRLPRIECTGGIAARRTGSETVHLVSAAATPLGGDRICVRVVVAPGARLRLRSAAATLALPGAHTADSWSCWHLDIGGDADIDVEPTIVAGSARHHTETNLLLGGSSSLRLRERAQIGRTGERQGFWTSALRADIDSAPLLRHRVELGEGAVGHDAIAQPLAAVSELRYPAASLDAPGVVLALGGGGALATWQGDRLTG